MKIVIADDDPAMLTRMRKALEKVDKNHIYIDICSEACDGEELIAAVRENDPVDLVISDMRMPNVDGLSALVALREEFQELKFIILTSESGTNIKEPANKEELAVAIGKIDLLEKIADRIRNGESSGNKIGTILEGCERLSMDPLAVAKHFGASGFIRKPISAFKIDNLFKEMNSSSSFIYIGLFGEK